MIRLIFSDMDGTLLDENGRLPEEFGNLYLRLRERGIIFAPASGRQYASLSVFCRQERRTRRRTLCYAGKNMVMC